ncbi:type II toxin-antitoxin system VapC family toxin [Candidatus Woesearchaeota archaeon]|nr:type II toxin-antitoxin system VapC family toxin [Candidatus Woesearchaeota archaeon]
MGKIALDTSVCIAMLKHDNFAQSLIGQFAEQKPCLPSVAAFELLLRTYSIREVEAFIRQTEILELDENAARKSAQISNELRKKGKTISTNDIFIAAITMENNCELATLNAKDFSKIRGLKLVKI